MKIFIVTWFNDKGDRGIDSAFSTCELAWSRVVAMIAARPNLVWEVEEIIVDDLIR